MLRLLSTAVGYCEGAFSLSSLNLRSVIVKPLHPVSEIARHGDPLARSSHLFMRSFIPTSASVTGYSLPFAQSAKKSRPPVKDSTRSTSVRRKLITPCLWVIHCPLRNHGLVNGSSRENIYLPRVWEAMVECRMATCRDPRP